jgi:FlaA1/EpsC-like NDP-sugar epimerase
MFIGFGVHRGEWRFTSTPDISAIVKSVLFATAVVAIAIFLATRLEAVPRSVFPLHGVLLIGLLIANRLLYRTYHARAGRGGPGRRVLVIGSGVAGEKAERSSPTVLKPFTDSTQTDLKALERTGMDPVSAHFQHTKLTEISDLLIRCN